MTSSERIVLATSLKPSDPENVQKRAVNSWLDAGFEVLSLNGEAELPKLEGGYPGVKFIPARRTGEAIAGRPVIFINDLLAALEATGSETIGIINGDIFISEQRDLLDFLSSESSKYMLAIPRLEVEDFPIETGELDPIGFDCFIFRRNHLDCWPATKFCLGMPYWDFWFPMMPLVRGNPLARLQSTCFRHIPHPTSRDDSFFLYADEFVSTILDAAQQSGGGLDLSTLNIENPAQHYALLKSKAAEVNRPGIDESARIKQFEELAVLQDEFSKLAIRYVHHNARPAVLDPS